MADREKLKRENLKWKAMKEAVSPKLQEAQLGQIGEEWPPVVVQEPAEAVDRARKGQAWAGCHLATQVQEVTGGRARLWVEVLAWPWRQSCYEPF